MIRLIAFLLVLIPSLSSYSQEKQAYCECNKEQIRATEQLISVLESIKNSKTKDDRFVLIKEYGHLNDILLDIKEKCSGLIGNSDITACPNQEKLNALEQDRQLILRILEIRENNVH